MFMAGDYIQERFPNGLQIQLKEIHTAPIISHWIWYRIGSRHEQLGATGISHWVEHMQFKGTPRFPAGTLDKSISRTGGIPSHSGKDPVAHILWLRHERPDVYRAAHAFLEPCDYLNARLTGRQVASYDSIVAHWLTDNRDLNAVRYDPQMLEWCGLTERQLPPLLPKRKPPGRRT